MVTYVVVKRSKDNGKSTPIFCRKNSTLNFHFPNSPWITMSLICFHEFCYNTNKKSFTVTILNVMKAPNSMPLHKVLSIEIKRLYTWHFVVSCMAGSECSRTETSTATIWHFLVDVRLRQIDKFQRTWHMDDEVQKWREHTKV